VSSFEGAIVAYGPIVVKQKITGVLVFDRRRSQASERVRSRVLAWPDSLPRGRPWHGPGASL